MTMLEISKIRTDGGTQPREALNPEVVKDYTEDMEAGAKFPPVKLIYDGGDYWLWDGFHRVAAAKAAGHKKIAVEVEQGTQADAQWLSLSANRDHGLRRTNADKQRAVKAALRHKVGADKSDRQIAEHVGVNHNTVGRIRAELAASGEIRQIEKRTVTRNGTTYTQDTSKIGKSQPVSVEIPQIKVTDEQIRAAAAVVLDAEKLMNTAYSLMDIPASLLNDGTRGYWIAAVGKGQLTYQGKLIGPYASNDEAINIRAALRQRWPNDSFLLVFPDAIHRTQAQYRVAQSLFDENKWYAYDEAAQELWSQPFDSATDVVRAWWRPTAFAYRGDRAFAAYMGGARVDKSPKAVKPAESKTDWAALTPEQAFEIATGGEDEPDADPAVDAMLENHFAVPAILKATKRYGAIMADPAWSYDKYNEAGVGNGTAATHYDVMSLPDIMRLPVGDLAADDCALFLWATMPLLQQAFQVGEAWGFEYKTCAFNWLKLKSSHVGNVIDTTGNNWFMGTGAWTRANSELCLLFTRGRPQRLRADVQQPIVSPVGEHSVKPAEALVRIEQLVAGPYLEMFARTPRTGWDVWGNDPKVINSSITFGGIEAGR